MNAFFEYFWANEWCNMLYVHEILIELYTEVGQKTKLKQEDQVEVSAFIPLTNNFT